MAVDLTHARVTFTEKVLLDRVTITRNPQHKRNAVFSETTGDYTSDDTPTVLAEDVPAKAKESSLQETPAEIGGVPVIDKLWQVKLDYTLAPEMAIGDLIEFTTAADPPLEGETLKVVRVYTGTLRVAREVQCRRRDSAVDRG